MGIALSLFLMNQGQIRRKETPLPDLPPPPWTQRIKADRYWLDDYNSFHREYIQDVLSHNNLPITKLSLYLFKHYHLIELVSGEKAWLDLYCNNHYPASYYAHETPSVRRFSSSTDSSHQRRLPLDFYALRLRKRRKGIKRLETVPQP